MDFEHTFPLVFLMNLARRQDRRARCRELFENHGLTAIRFPAVDALHLKRERSYQSKGRYAHAVTTRLMIREAKRRKASAVFILEDDVVFAEDWRERLAEIRLPADWGLFYLGCQHVERPEVSSPGIMRARGALDTHAFGIKAEFYDVVMRALARPQSRIPAYAAYPNLAWQEDEHSDLAGGSYSNYLPEGTQKWWEDIMAGTVAEALGGKAWPSVAEEGKTVKGWFRSSPVPGIPAPVFWASSPDTTGSFPTSPPQPGMATKGNIAFLFLTRAGHHLPEVWEQYWNGAENWSVYSHIAQRERKTDGWVGDARISGWVDTKWGDISLVRAQLALLKAALRDTGNQWFQFLSESCVPIRPFADLRQLLEWDGRSRFGWSMWTNEKERNPLKAARSAAALRIPDSVFTFHSQWVLLDRESAELIVEDDFTRFFAPIHAPDECYFGTVLKMKGYPLERRIASEDMTWGQWPLPGKPHPRILRRVSNWDAAALASSGRFFARKFAEGSNIGRFGLHRGCSAKT